MSGLIGQLRVNVIGSTEGFRRTLKKARTQMNLFRDDAKKMHRNLKSAVGTLESMAAAVGATVAVGFVKNIAAATRETAKLSKQLGVSHQEMEMWAHLANRANYTVDELADAFKDVGERFNEWLVEGTGEAAEVARELGFVREEWEKMNPVEQAQALMESVNALEDAGAQLRILRKAASDAGQDVLQGVLGDPKALREGMDIFNQTMSSANLEEFTEASKEMSRAWADFGLVLKSVVVNPEFTAFIRELTDALALLNDTVGLLRSTGIFRMRGMGLSTISAFQRAREQDSFGQGLSTFGAELALSTPGSGNLTDGQRAWLERAANRKDVE